MVYILDVNLIYIFLVMHLVIWMNIERHLEAKGILNNTNDKTNMVTLTSLLTPKNPN